jgi:hypothetical protein
VYGGSKALGFISIFIACSSAKYLLYRRFSIFSGSATTSTWTTLVSSNLLESALNLNLVGDMFLLITKLF